MPKPCIGLIMSANSSVMSSYQSPHYSSALEQAVDRYPLQVTADRSLGEVITLMSQKQNYCILPQQSSTVDLDQLKDNIVAFSTETKAGCVLVVDDVSAPQSLLGVVTERDLLHLIAKEHSNGADSDFHQMPISEVMSSTPLTLTDSQEQDIFSALALFREHQIEHLPFIDQQGKVLGVITPERIRQVLQPSNILRIRRVVDEMSTDVVTAPSSTSILSLAQMMAAHQVGCVVIYASSTFDSRKSASSLTQSRLTPVGIVTAHDIIQAQFLELNLAQISAEQIMGLSIFSLKPNDSLWTAHQEMQKRHLQWLLVCGDDGKLLGLITQISLLRMLDPTEMYRVVRNLQQSVYQLQLEKLELLRNRNVELGKQVQKRTAELNDQLQRERLMTKISLQIHQSLNLAEILSTTAVEVQQVLEVDRVVIYQISPAQEGEMVAEAVAPQWRSLSGSVLNQSVIDNYLAIFATDYVYTLNCLSAAKITPEEKQRLEQYQIQAYLVVPILQDGQLWGMIGAHQCSQSREWQTSELNLMRQLATQLAIATQQAQLYEQVQALNTDLEQQVHERTLELQEKIKELEELNCLKDAFVSTVSHELRTPLTNMKMAIKMLGIRTKELLPDDDRHQKYLEILDSECAREINLVNDLLDLQRLEVNSNHISRISVDLLTLTAPLIQSFKSRANKRKQVLNVNFSDQIPTIYTNPDSLERIIVELLNNACKYTADGGEINLDIIEQQRIDAGEADQNCYVQLSVSNSAEIPPEELPKIFDKFYRIPNADPWEQGGTGLGLALVEKLVEQLDGKIEVMSQQGETTFRVTIPQGNLTEISTPNQTH